MNKNLYIIIITLILYGCASNSLKSQKPIYLSANSKNPPVVSALGEIKANKNVDHITNITIPYVIANAGGFINRRANKKDIRIIREGKLIAIINWNKFIKGEEKNIKLQKGDIIYIPSSLMAKLSDKIQNLLTPFIDTGGSVINAAKTASDITTVID